MRRLRTDHRSLAEIFRRALADCPACGGALTKLISNCAFHLKGGGWYVSDYSSSRPNSAPPDAAKEATDSDAGKTSPPAEAAAPAESK
jgi:predicted nucleic acid-binding Zn ribbon protein